MELLVPLSATQVAAAGRLHKRFPEWVATERALWALGERFPEFVLESALLKVAALNQLYSTNIYGVGRMAQHVVRVMRQHDQEDDHVALVEELAMLPPASTAMPLKRYTSFASKFCHFFVDRDRYPIYDSYAVKTITYHLGSGQETRNATRPYWSFVQNLDRLRHLARLSCSLMEMDHYLWLAGIYRYWLGKPNAKIGVEVALMLATPPPDVLADLALLVPETPFSTKEAPR